MHSKAGRLLTAAVILVTAAAVVGCGGGDSATSASGSKAKTIGVMVSAPLSGDSAESGKDMLHGAQLAAEYVNEQGGIAAGPEKGAKLKVTGGDDAMSTKGALAVASKYVQDDNQWLLTGFLDSGMTLAAAQVAKRQNLAVISSFACSTKLEAFPNVAIQCPLLAGMAAASVNFASTQLNAKRVAVITSTEAFIPDYLKGIEDEAKKLGVTIATTQRFKLGSTTDFSALVENMKSAHPDAVISLAYQADAGRILTTMRRSGFNVPFVDALTEGWDTAFFGAGGSALTKGDGAYGQYAGAKFPEPGSLLDKMNQRFQEKWGKAMPTSAAYVFDSVLSGASAIAAGAKSRQEVADHWSDVSGEGVTGKLGYGKGNRVAGASLTVAKVTGKAPSDVKLAALYQLDGENATKVK
jgi:branched-chain amino acid transport system substrate-binding protein